MFIVHTFNNNFDINFKLNSGNSCQLADISIEKVPSLTTQVLDQKYTYNVTTIAECHNKTNLNLLKKVMDIYVIVRYL